MFIFLVMFNFQTVTQDVKTVLFKDSKFHSFTKNDLIINQKLRGWALNEGKKVHLHEAMISD